MYGLTGIASSFLAENNIILPQASSTSSAAVTSMIPESNSVPETTMAIDKLENVTNMIPESNNVPEVTVAIDELGKQTENLEEGNASVSQ